jgi:hypothetical protein
LQADTGSCRGVTITLPFNDVMASPFFCQIASAYFSGLTNGTSATAYSPGDTVTREQMAAFTTRTLDQSLKRGSQRAVAKKWWTPDVSGLASITMGSNPTQVEFDGTDLWVANRGTTTVMRVRPSDGKILGTWTGATVPHAIVAAMGRIFVAAGPSSTPGSLYMIDPSQPPGAVTTVTSSLGELPQGIAFDGLRIWTAEFNGHSISIVSLTPLTVTSVRAGFDRPTGMLYEGVNIWVTDSRPNAGALHKLNPDGSIAQTLTVGHGPGFPVFDGTNIWVPNKFSHSVTVVRVKDATGNPLPVAFELATLTGNGLNQPATVAFDGERILVTNSGGTTVSMWKAADLTPLGNFSLGNFSFPYGVCSDGLNFWITLPNSNLLTRF